MRYTRWVLGGVATVSILIASLVLSNQGASAAGSFGTTRASAGFARAHALDHVVTRINVKKYDRAGSVIFRATYTPRQFRAVQKTLSGHGTGGTSTGEGRTKVTISNTGQSLLGFDLWKQKVWIDWNWYRPDHIVYMNDQGRDWDVIDGTWQWDGWQSEHSHYFTWYGNVTKSGYHKDAQGSFSGPCINPATRCHRYPQETLEAHSNGTNEWWN